LKSRLWLAKDHRKLSH